MAALRTYRIVILHEEGWIEKGCLLSILLPVGGGSKGKEQGGRRKSGYKFRKIVGEEKKVELFMNIWALKNQGLGFKNQNPIF